jgi:hypothetical protein
VPNADAVTPRSQFDASGVQRSILGNPDKSPFCDFLPSTERLPVASNGVRGAVPVGEGRAVQGTGSTSDAGLGRTRRNGLEVSLAVGRRSRRAHPGAVGNSQSSCGQNDTPDVPMRKRCGETTSTTRAALRSSAPMWRQRSRSVPHL